MPTKLKYDAFLSYAREDSKSVQSLAPALVDSGIKVWLDTWSLVPGESWQESLKSALDESSSAVVFLGRSGLGRWQEAEIQEMLRHRASDTGVRLIPVLLPGARTESVPPFLQNRVWIDFRQGVNDKRALSRLVSALARSPGGSEIEQEQGLADDLMAAGDASQAIRHY
ncbi:MAG: toll/interleukin-1 receptor domain-containing protein [Methylococcales bacterium]